MPLTDPQKAALSRLQSFYEGDNPYNSVTNPGGFRQGGHLYNFVNALKDIATVVTGAAALATEVASNSVQSPKAVRVDADQGYTAGEQAQGRKNLGLATVLSDYAKKAGDTFTDLVRIKATWPSLDYLFSAGTYVNYFWRTAGDNNNGNLYFQYIDPNGNGLDQFKMNRDGSFYAPNIGEISARIENRAAAFAAQRIARTGDTMTGTMTVQFNGPNIVLTQVGGSYDKYAWNIYHYQVDGSLYFQDYQNGVYKANSVRFDRNGAINTAQFGDLSARIEYRASAFADDRLATARAEYGTKVAKTGDTMTGGLTVPRVVINGTTGSDGLIINSRTGNDAYMLVNQGNQFTFYDIADGGTKLSIGKDGAVGTAQFGDLNARIEARGAAYQAAAYAQAQAYALGRSGDQVMTGNLQINKGYPRLSFMYGGVWHGGFQLDADGVFRYYNFDDGNARLAISPNGALYTSQFGDLNNRIEARGLAYQQAAQSTSVQKAGSEMTGDLTINKAYPQTIRNYPNIRQWIEGVREDGHYYWLDNSGGGARFSVRYDGSLWCSQLGDINSRIENRAKAFADAAQTAATNARGDRVYKGGDTMTGDLRIEKGYPSVVLYHPGVLAGSWMVLTDARMSFRNSDSGAIYCSFGADGSASFNQIGDLASRIENRASAFAENARVAAYNACVSSTRMVYVGDQHVAAQAGGGMLEPYGASWISGRSTALNPQQDDFSLVYHRWRQLQQYIPNAGGWVASYYA